MQREVGMAGEQGGAPPDAGALRAELALLLRRLTVELDAVGQRFAEQEGLGRTDVRALTSLMDATRAGRPMSAGTLGAAVDLSSASVTALVDRLERMGHVRRVRDEHDRRRVVVEVSDSAMDAGRRFFGTLQRDLVARMDGYADDELAVVHRWLTDMTETIERHSRPERTQR
jgi:DNA-binding MarR family transcriptional regulator